MTIVEFLRARHDEDADYARDAAEEVGDGHWQQRGPRIVTVADRDREVTDYGITECIWHLVRHDPARVLAEVEAKRRILDEHAPVQQGIIWTGPHGAPGTECLPDWRCGRCSDYFPDADYDEDTHASHSWPCLTVRVLALPYADHPDYDPSWSPS